jgi:hypothetical protein
MEAVEGYLQLKTLMCIQAMWHKTNKHKKAKNENEEQEKAKAATA